MKAKKLRHDDPLANDCGPTCPACRANMEAEMSEVEMKEKAARLKERERQAMIRSYAQTIYLNWISNQLAPIDRDEVKTMREEWREMRDAARIAAEVLFEEES